MGPGTVGSSLASCWFVPDVCPWHDGWMIAAFSITPLGVGPSVSEPVAEAAPRVSVIIKIDHRVGVTDGLHAKVDAIEQRLTGG